MIHLLSHIRQVCLSLQILATVFVLLDASKTNPISLTTNQTPVSPARLVMLNQPNDTMAIIYATKAGEVTGDFEAMNTSMTTTLRYAMDNQTSTSYVSYRSALNVNVSNSTDAIDSGFIVVPSIHNATVACALRFATGSRGLWYDPMSVTLEGSNDTDMSDLHFNSAWSLIYNGSTGINDTDAPRATFGFEQRFNNAQRFASYRLLITEKRGNQTGDIEYSEAQIMGYFP